MKRNPPDLGQQHYAFHINESLNIFDHISYQTLNLHNFWLLEINHEYTGCIINSYSVEFRSLSNSTSMIAMISMK